MTSFKKIDSGRYEYIVSKELEDKIDRIVNEISLGEADKFFNIHNMQLYDSIMSRYVAALFFQEGNTIENHFGFLNIKVKLHEREFKVTLGDIYLDKNHKYRVNGVLYEK